MIYIDDANLKRKVGPYSSKRWFHMIADPPNDDELIAFGHSIGLNRKWLQRSRNGFTHYDITAGIKRKALAAGAIQITVRQLADKLQALQRLRGKL